MEKKPVGVGLPKPGRQEKKKNKKNKKTAGNLLNKDTAAGLGLRINQQLGKAYSYS